MSAEHITCAKIEEAIAAFALEGKLLAREPYGNGHINDTFRLVYEEAEGKNKRYILQRMNHEIFKNPVELMENIVHVTEYLRKQIEAQGGNPDRETLNVVKTRDDRNYYKDSLGNYWRIFLFVEDTVCLEKVEQPGDFYDSGAAFGNFQKLLADFPAARLHETIPNFHDTPSRYAAFEEAAAKDMLGRKRLAEKEIEFAVSRKAEASALTDLLKEGKLPLRVTHNDTKLNNILFDRESRKALCIIDLDTVMPGLSLYDFGDSIRFGASTGAEDEQDLSRIEMDLELFEAFTKGYLEGCGGSLTQKETELLPLGAKMMTYECGLRFLTDYLQGDTYFKVHRDGQNLDRARTQFKLVADMEKKWEAMQEIVRRNAGNGY